MKKCLILLFILSAFTSLSLAQMQIGPKVGLNLASLTGDDVEDTESKTGFAGGVFFMYKFSDMFAIQPEAYYSMKGATDKMDFEEDVTVDLTYTLDYIEVPLLLKLLIPIQGSSINPAIFAGPSVGFKSTAKVKAEYEGESSEEDLENITSTDFGLVFGGGLGFPIGKNELGFDVRYIMGLATIDDTEDPDDVKNSVINFNIYFGFSL